MTDENKNQDPEKKENRTHDNVISLYGDNNIENDVVKTEVSNQECARNIKNEVGDDKSKNIVNNEMEGSLDTAPNGGSVDPILQEASMHTLPTTSDFKKSVAPESYNKANSSRFEDTSRRFEDTSRKFEDNSKKFDDRGEFRSATDGTAVIGTSSRTMRLLGWISTILTAFVSPYFALAGILFGVLSNRQERGSGNAIIITNIVLAAINILFGFFLIGLVRRIMFGY